MMAMRVAGLLTLVSLVAPALSTQSNRPGKAETPPPEIHPTMILWKTGLVETITPATLGDRNTWRVAHYPQDPSESKTNDYDLYDLDRTTFAPLRSLMNSEDRHLELIFSQKEVVVHQTSGRDTSEETISLSGPVQPEGPGLDVFVARLPLVVGYQTQYAIVDRWSGHGSARVKPVTLSVLKSITKDTAMGKLELYELLIRPNDGSFQVREQVLARSPHFPVRVEYTREGKTYPASEVIAITSSTDD